MLSRRIEVGAAFAAKLDSLQSRLASIHAPGSTGSELALYYDEVQESKSVPTLDLAQHFSTSICDLTHEHIVDEFEYGDRDVAFCRSPEAMLAATTVICGDRSSGKTSFAALLSGGSASILQVLRYHKSELWNIWFDLTEKSLDYFLSQCGETRALPYLPTELSITRILLPPDELYFFLSDEELSESSELSEQDLAILQKLHTSQAQHCMLRIVEIGGDLMDQMIKGESSEKAGIPVSSQRRQKLFEAVLDQLRAPMTRSVTYFVNCEDSLGDEKAENMLIGRIWGTLKEINADGTKEELLLSLYLAKQKGIASRLGHSSLNDVICATERMLVLLRGRFQSEGWKELEKCPNDDKATTLRFMNSAGSCLLKVTVSMADHVQLAEGCDTISPNYGAVLQIFHRIISLSMHSLYSPSPNIKHSSDGSGAVSTTAERILEGAVCVEALLGRALLALMQRRGLKSINKTILAQELFDDETVKPVSEEEGTSETHSRTSEHSVVACDGHALWDIISLVPPLVLHDGYDAAADFLVRGGYAVFMDCPLHHEAGGAEQSTTPGSTVVMLCLCETTA